MEHSCIFLSGSRPADRRPDRGKRANLHLPAGNFSSGDIHRDANSPSSFWQATPRFKPPNKQRAQSTHTSKPTSMSVRTEKAGASGCDPAPASEGVPIGHRTDPQTLLTSARVTDTYCFWKRGHGNWDLVQCSDQDFGGLLPLTLFTI